MKTSKFKKLAMLGITGGVLAAAQAPVAVDASVGTILAAKCGSGSCGGAYRPQGSCGAAPQYPNGNPQGQWQAQGGCSGAQNPRGYTADAGNMPQMQDQQYQRQDQRNMPRAISENDLLNRLSSDTKSIYMALDADGKIMVMQFANQGMEPNDAVRSVNSRKDTFTRRGSFQQQQQQQPQSQPQPYTTRPSNYNY